MKNKNVLLQILDSKETNCRADIGSAQPGSRGDDVVERPISTAPEGLQCLQKIQGIVVIVRAMLTLPRTKIARS